VVWQPTRVTAATRANQKSQKPAVVWFTGLSGSGKSTIAIEVERRLTERGVATYVLDGDNVRHGLNADLGFGAADRAENVRRLGEVARLMADAGLVVLVPAISPYGVDRDRVRAAHAEAGLAYVEAFVDTPLDLCEQRDPKGLYREARAGRLTGFTGIDDPYEPPVTPDLRIGPAPLEEQVDAVMAGIRAVIGDR
jgi:bifunctional enzyme CysN/CysC